MILSKLIILLILKFSRISIFINFVFITKYKLSKIILFKFCKFRLINDKLIFNITYIIFVKMIIKNYIKKIDISLSNSKNLKLF